jgi:hypothetical protein
MDINMFDFFRRKKKSSTESSESKIQFEFRDEGITYRLPDKHMHLWSTWTNGARLYTETIAKWEDGSVLTRDEKKRVFNEVVLFVGQKDEKPIIVINSDDPSKALWEDLCLSNQLFIKNIEYTSREEQSQFERNMYLGFIKAGKKVILDGIELSNEKDLDEFMQKRGRNHAA